MTNKEKYADKLIELAVKEEVFALKNGETALCAKIKCEDSCNCQHNSNSRENEPCCRCDSRQTNADRIRNMSDEELADTLFNSCLEFMHIDECHYADNVGMCKKCISEWLQSEAE